MRSRGCSIALVGLLLGCSSLTRPDGEELVVAERTEPAVVVAPPSTIASPTNEANAANEGNVALAAQQPQPNAPPQLPVASKQGG